MSVDLELATTEQIIHELARRPNLRFIYIQLGTPCPGSTDEIEMAEMNMAVMGMTRSHVHQVLKKAARCNRTGEGLTDISRMEEQDNG